MKSFEEKLRELGLDNISGARELADRAAQYFFDLLRRHKKTPREKLVQEISGLSNRLLDLQPSIGPIYNLCNGLLLLLETEKPDFSIPEAGKEWLALFRRRLSRNVEELRLRALDLLPDRGVVLTHSYSSTVVETLLASRKLGKSIRVFCTEGRPNLEGRRLARELAEAGIPVRLGVDAAMYSWIDEVDLVLVGCDAISKRGLVNKIGTTALARTVLGQSRIDRAKIYALADSEKIVPTALAERVHIPAKDPAEIWDLPRGSIEVVNRYFEMTPLAWLDGIVTESGVQDSETLLQHADRTAVSPRLAPPKKSGLRREALGEIAKGLAAPAIAESEVKVIL